MVSEVPRLTMAAPAMPRLASPVLQLLMCCFEVFDMTIHSSVGHLILVHLAEESYSFICNDPYCIHLRTHKYTYISLCMTSVSLCACITSTFCHKTTFSRSPGHALEGATMAPTCWMAEEFLDQDPVEIWNTEIHRSHPTKESANVRLICLRIKSSKF